MHETNVYEVRIFEYGDYIIETIGKNTGEREAWLRHKDYGIALHMFGISGGTEGDFLHTVENNLEEYIKDYNEEVISNDV